jgi:UDP-N-acetylmuramate dehydrogenase
MSRIADVLPKIRGEYRFNFPLNKSNWFNVGGPAEVLFKPADEEDLVHFFRNIELDHDPLEPQITVLGVGSNVIIRDNGIDGVVIKLGRSFTNIKREGNTVSVGASCLNHNFAHFCADNGLAGMEFIIGIPGSIGGGVAMNAGAYGSEFQDHFKHVKAVDYDGNIHIIKKEDMGFKYRGHDLAIKRNLVFIEATFELFQDDPEAIRARMNEIIRKREETQPVREKTGGSTFRNPESAHISAWKLIDEAGFRGFKMGGASISEKHCNFMINDGTATAADLEALGNYVQKKICLSTGIFLEWEIKRIGRKY